jgi:hypothetical protein
VQHEARGGRVGALERRSPGSSMSSVPAGPGRSWSRPQTRPQYRLLDSGPDADVVRERLADIVRFCLDFNGTNVFLVEGLKLDETDWGKQIQSLADLRLVHEIGNVTVQSSDYRGRRFVAFTLDLSNYTGTRSEHIRQIEFWTRIGKQGIRRVGLLYEPENDRTSPRRTLGQEPAPVNWDEPALPGLEDY